MLHKSRAFVRGLRPRVGARWTPGPPCPARRSVGSRRSVRHVTTYLLLLFLLLFSLMTPLFPYTNILSFYSELLHLFRVYTGWPFLLRLARSLNLSYLCKKYFPATRNRLFFSKKGSKVSVNVTFDDVWRSLMIPKNDCEIVSRINFDKSPSFEKLFREKLIWKFLEFHIDYHEILYTNLM